MQRIVARPSSAHVAVPMPVELHYSPTSTELAMRSLQNIGIHLVRKGKWKTACTTRSYPVRPLTH
uniref:ATM interactor n=1 Tax=Rousettus aegyptiacus TaxID=9407 RepID=A0A7J8CDV6_ROUAE|nr:ATM interactor [Rousettus aegyptiacus]